MSKAVWIVNLPENSKVEVEKNQAVSIDEVLVDEDGEKITAPANGKIIDVSEGKIKFEFDTSKISGKSLTEKHVWGQLSWSPQLNYSRLDSEYQGKIIVINLENLTPHFASKARALGVSGIITFPQKENGENLSKKELIPILVVDKKSKNLIKKKDGVKCLLNGGKNCLLVPEAS